MGIIPCRPPGGLGDWSTFHFTKEREAHVANREMFVWIFLLSKVTAEHNEVGMCHCEMCRRWTSWADDGGACGQGSGNHWIARAYHGLLLRHMKRRKGVGGAGRRNFARNAVTNLYISYGLERSWMNICFRLAWLERSKGVEI